MCVDLDRHIAVYYANIGHKNDPEADRRASEAREKIIRHNERTCPYCGVFAINHLRQPYRAGRTASEGRVPLRCCPICATITTAAACPPGREHGWAVPTMTRQQLEHRARRYEAGRGLLLKALAALCEAEGGRG